MNLYVLFEYINFMACFPYLSQKIVLVDLLKIVSIFRKWTLSSKSTIKPPWLNPQAFVLNDML